MEDVTLDEVIDVLRDVNEDPDYEHSTTLVDARELDSFDILSIISALDDEFDISIPAKDVVPENFNSAQAIHAMVCRLMDED